MFWFEVRAHAARYREDEWLADLYGEPVPRSTRLGYLLRGVFGTIDQRVRDAACRRWGCRVIDPTGDYHDQYCGRCRQSNPYIRPPY